MLTFTLPPSIPCALPTLHTPATQYPPAYRLQPTLARRLEPPRGPTPAALVLCARAQSIAKSMPRALQCVDEEGEERLAAER